MVRWPLCAALQLPQLVKKEAAMETLSYRHKAQERAAGSKSLAIIGVVASGNLEVLVERVLLDTECQVDIKHSG